GRGRHDSVHGDARTPVSRGAISDYRRARSAIERAWPERISACSLCEKTDCMCGGCACRARVATLEQFQLSAWSHRDQLERAGGVTAEQQLRDVDVELRPRR